MHNSKYLYYNLYFNKVLSYLSLVMLADRACLCISFIYFNIVLVRLLPASYNVLTIKSLRLFGVLFFLSVNLLICFGFYDNFQFDPRTLKFSTLNPFQSCLTVIMLFPFIKHASVATSLFPQ